MAAAAHAPADTKLQLNASIEFFKGFFGSKNESLIRQAVEIQHKIEKKEEDINKARNEQSAEAQRRLERFGREMNDLIEIGDTEKSEYCTSMVPW